MIRNSIHTYDSAASPIGNLPDRSIVQVENTAIFIQVVSKGSATTIQDILDGVGTYIDLNVPERAGFGYSPLTKYKPGDLVTFEGIGYYAKIDIGIGPGNAPVHGAFTKWGAQRTTNAYDSTIDYEAGEVVVIGDDIYVAPVGGAPAIDPDPGVPGSPWNLTTPNEQGGVVYDPSRQYEIGDVVTISDMIYVIGEDPTNPGNPPPIGTLPGDPEWISTPIDSERGGIGWKDAQKYSVGDTVYDNSVGPPALYICTTAHTSVAGGSGNGEPQNPASLNWSDTITADPGSY